MTTRDKTEDQRLVEIDRMGKALRRCEEAAMGTSNDREINALRDALDMALERWPEFS